MCPSCKSDVSPLDAHAGTGRPYRQSSDLRTFRSLFRLSAGLIVAMYCPHESEFRRVTNAAHLRYNVEMYSSCSGRTFGTEAARAVPGQWYMSMFRAGRQRHVSGRISKAWLLKYLWSLMMQLRACETVNRSITAPTATASSACCC